MENENALKHMYDRALLERMGASLKKVYPKFDRSALNALSKKFPDLEMKPRVRAIRDELKRQLPDDYLKTLDILLKSIKTGHLSGFDYWPYSEYIQTHGLGHPTSSLQALETLTPLFTSEWAVRPYLAHHPEKTLKFLQKATKHPRKSIRRWASEGSRPRLPWGERLNAFIKEPRQTAEILNALKYDDELFVRKSVANHINDIAKDNPDYVIELLSEWTASAPEKHLSKIEWITRHALRSLIKAGHPGALKLLGIAPNARIDLKNLNLRPSTLHFGDSLVFSFDLHSNEKKTQKVIVDYVIDFVKANGKTTPKVFKLKTFILKAGETVSIRKSHTVRKITTREYFAGKHTLSIQMNGIVVARKNWRLEIR